MPNSRGPRFQRIIHTCTGMFLFIVCDTFSSIASLNVQCRLRRPRSHIHPLFPPFTPRFLPLPSARRGCSVRSRCSGSGGDACACAPAAIKQTQAPPTKITSRVKAQQPGRSLQEAIRDGDPAMTDQQSHTGRCRSRVINGCSRLNESKTCIPSTCRSAG